jgi:HupE / UreJ protein
MKMLTAVFICLWSVFAFAHKPSDSYLSIALENKQLSGRWDIAIRDLDFAIGLDDNDDGAITWGELRSKTTVINHYVFEHLQLGVAGSACSIRQQGLKIDQHSDGSYAVLNFNGACEAAASDGFIIAYHLFADLDPQHRGLLNLTYDKANTTTAVLVPSHSPRVFKNTPNRSHWQDGLDFIREGVWHIWIGYDHILFLFSLLIPSVMVYQAGRWQSVASFRNAFWDVLKVVTAFTVAHSITLSLAVLDIIALPSRWVESCIAASVILAALNNIFPVFTEKRALLALTFGLIHGFGFASVLADLGLQESAKLWSLLGFNLGVEIGQLALVILFLPFAYKFSRYHLYKPVVIKTFSLGIAGLGSVWLLERAWG